MGAAVGNRNWTAKRVHPAIVQVDISLSSMSDCAWVLLRGDAHHDNPHSDHDLQRQHLDEAIRRGAAVIDVGDLFCAMGGKADPRIVKGGVTRDEHAQAPDYFDSLVRHNAAFLEPYAANIVQIGQGNHETAVLKRQETCLTTRLVERINANTGANVIAGGYGGWVAFRMECAGTRATAWMKWFHGSGGGGLMSFDTLRVRRQASFVSGADVVVCGHVHERWALEIMQEHPRSQNGKYALERRSQWHVRTGTYKDEYRDGSHGWHVERGGPPKPLGGYWMRLWMESKQNDGNRTRRPRIELVPT